MTHVRYTEQRIASWRQRAKAETASARTSCRARTREELRRWPRQVACLRRCRKFLERAAGSKRDFFVPCAFERILFFSCLDEWFLLDYPRDKMVP